MRNNSTGGMRVSALHYSIYCEKCRKPSARMDKNGNIVRYLHFTKKGSVWHEINAKD